MKETPPTGVEVGSLRFGAGSPLVLIAGPCVLEGRDHALRHAAEVAAICAKFSLPYIFKASFDKANRTSIQSYRGPGIEEGLLWLAAVKEETGLPVTTDIHLPEQAKPAAEVVDLLQIPAFLCRQTDLLLAAARTGKPVNIKKGQFLAPEDMKFPLNKVKEEGNQGVLLTERGTSFGYHRLVVDFTGLVTMRSLGVPVVFDATHSVQRPGGGGDRTAGNRDMIPPLAKAALAVGVDGLFLEVHEDPDHAPSDGPNMVPLAKLEELLTSLLEPSGKGERR